MIRGCAKFYIRSIWSKSTRFLQFLSISYHEGIKKRRRYEVCFGRTRLQYGEIIFVSTHRLYLLVRFLTSRVSTLIQMQLDLPVAQLNLKGFMGLDRVAQETKELNVMSPSQIILLGKLKKILLRRKLRQNRKNIMEINTNLLFRRNLRKSKTPTNPVKTTTK